MGDTSISWTDKTWNPIRGCSRVSEGCRNCYAERQGNRFRGPGQAFEGLVVWKAGPRWTGEVRFVAEHLADPLRWRKPQRVFVNSMSDLFHEKLTNEQIAAVFGVMAACPQLRDQCAAAGVPYFLKQATYHSEPEATTGTVCFGSGSREKAGGVI